MDTSSNDSVTPMVSNEESDLSSRFDAIIDGSFFDQIIKDFEYCMGHPNLKKQFIQVLLEHRKKSIMHMMCVNLNCSTNTKKTTITDNDVGDEVDNATTNEFYARKKRLLQLLGTYPELHVMLSKF